MNAEMRIKLFVACLFLFASGCHPSATKVPSVHPSQTASSADASSVLDFDDLQRRIKKINTSDMAYLDANWPSLKAELHGYLDTGQMAQLTVEQQEAIYMDLDYLQGCYSGDVLRKYGDEIREITNQLKLTDETRKFVESINSR